MYTDILNPSPSHPLNPDYGFVRKRPVTHQTIKAARGAPYFRDITDVGHQFALNWIDRPRSTAQALKRFYEQYRDGCFTFIDHEGGGRHYVGRFVTDVQPIPTRHGAWTVQQVVFDEIPGMAMLKYPADWQNDAVWSYIVTDFNEFRVALDTPADWVLIARPSSPCGYLLSTQAIPTTCHFGYVGYGFQLWGIVDSDHGKAAVTLDGTLVGHFDAYATSRNERALLIEKLDVPLGVHTIDIVTEAKNPSSSDSYVEFWGLRVMR